MGRLSGFLAVSIGTKFRLGLAVVLLSTVRIGLFVVPFASFRRVLLASMAVLARLVPGSPSPEYVAWAVQTADESVPGHRTCLMRSLTSEAIHRLYGHDIVHRIGVTEDDDAARSDGDSVTGIEAHSWIEYEGDVIIGDLEDLSRYEPLPPLNGSERS